MTDERKEYWRDAWFPVGLCAIGVIGLIVQGLIWTVPPVIQAVSAALDL